MDYRIVFKRSETTGGGLTEALAGGFTVFVMELKNVTMKELKHSGDLIEFQTETIVVDETNLQRDFLQALRYDSATGIIETDGHPLTVDDVGKQTEILEVAEGGVPRTGFIVNIAEIIDANNFRVNPKGGASLPLYGETVWYAPRLYKKKNEAAKIFMPKETVLAAIPVDLIKE